MEGTSTLIDPIAIVSQLRGRCTTYSYISFVIRDRRSFGILNGKLDYEIKNIYGSVTVKFNENNKHVGPRVRKRGHLDRIGRFAPYIEPCQSSRAEEYTIY